MDPYLEQEAASPDFHNGLIAEIRNELGLRLPDSYVARVDERIEVDHDPQEIRINWVEVRALPDLELVTAVEILSPIRMLSLERSRPIAADPDPVARARSGCDDRPRLFGQPRLRPWSLRTHSASRPSPARSNTTSPRGSRVG
jgi:hypothetical protein